ncbi:hypothetical protein PoB_004697500 [Plakobranchus ocellatus]|uniref:Uncharacterized protein n=1 Tax=Plakobranchus ocellatus TaxID=259542 RepID=A0AAV4BIZ2_9GAST|nr:hypothetical protein PoB_004697500 [Plakobranchus ocellatus]
MLRTRSNPYNKNPYGLQDSKWQPGDEENCDNEDMERVDPNVTPLEVAQMLANRPMIEKTEAFFGGLKGQWSWLLLGLRTPGTMVMVVGRVKDVRVNGNGCWTDYGRQGQWSWLLDGLRTSGSMVMLLDRLRSIGSMVRVAGQLGTSGSMVMVVGRIKDVRDTGHGCWTG